MGKKRAFDEAIEGAISGIRDGDEGVVKREVALSDVAAVLSGERLLAYRELAWVAEAGGLGEGMLERAGDFFKIPADVRKSVGVAVAACSLARRVRERDICRRRDTTAESHASTPPTSPTLPATLRLRAAEQVETIASESDLLTAQLATPLGAAQRASVLLALRKRNAQLQHLSTELSEKSRNE